MEGIESSQEEPDIDELSEPPDASLNILQRNQKGMLVTVFQDRKIPISPVEATFYSNELTRLIQD